MPVAPSSLHRPTHREPSPSAACAADVTSSGSGSGECSLATRLATFVGFCTSCAFFVSSDFADDHWTDGGRLPRRIFTHSVESACCQLRRRDDMGETVTTRPHRTKPKTTTHAVSHNCNGLLDVSENGFEHNSLKKRGKMANPN